MPCAQAFAIRGLGVYGSVLKFGIVCAHAIAQLYNLTLY